MALAHNMRLDGLKRAAAKARGRVGRAEAKAEKLQRNFSLAKAVLEQAQSKYVHARKAADRARRMALAAEARVSRQIRAWERAEKRLAKGAKKAGAIKATGARRSPLTVGAPRKTIRRPRGRPASLRFRNLTPGSEGVPAAASLPSITAAQWPD